MKSISGNLVSVHPISLSKAAGYISDFSSFGNNGADEVVSKYLNRASEAFNSLLHLHKHPQSSQRKRVLAEKEKMDKKESISVEEVEERK